MVAINRTEEEKAALIERYIERDRHKPGLYSSVIVGTRIPVWIIISRFRVINGGNGDLAAAEYDQPREVIEAVLAFYERHAAWVDARIEEAQAWFACDAT